MRAVHVEYRPWRPGAGGGAVAVRWIGAWSAAGRAYNPARSTHRARVPPPDRRFLASARSEPHLLTRRYAMHSFERRRGFGWPVAILTLAILASLAGLQP